MSFMAFEAKTAEASLQIGGRIEKPHYSAKNKGDMQYAPKLG